MFYRELGIQLNIPSNIPQDTPIPPFTIKVQFDDKDPLTILAVSDFEKIFKVTYRPFLTFPSHQTLAEVIRNCPYLLRLEWLFGTSGKQEAGYHEQLLRGAFADAIIKWINPEMGYGLFAAADIPKKTFVGEYTGLIRRVDRTCPTINPYCFHYPTRFWSANYFVIDSMREGNLSRFINHSDRPNLQPLWLINHRVLHLILIANRLIRKGEELTFNYGSHYWRYRKKVIK